MIVRHFLEVEPKEFTDQAKGVNIRVVIGEQEGAFNFVMRVFELDPGGYTPRHAHPWEHEVFVLGGQGEVIAQGKSHRLKQGDTVFIPGGEEHQFLSSVGSSLKFICIIPRPPDKKS